MALSPISPTTMAKVNTSSEKPAGLLRVAWETAPGRKARELHLTWAESGGPPVVQPARRGFGSKATSSKET